MQKAQAAKEQVLSWRILLVGRSMIGEEFRYPFTRTPLTSISRSDKIQLPAPRACSLSSVIGCNGNLLCFSLPCACLRILIRSRINAIGLGTSTHGARITTIYALEFLLVARLEYDLHVLPQPFIRAVSYLFDFCGLLWFGMRMHFACTTFSNWILLTYLPSIWYTSPEAQLDLLDDRIGMNSCDLVAGWVINLFPDPCWGINCNYAIWTFPVAWSINSDLLTANQLKSLLVKESISHAKPKDI